MSSTPATASGLGQRIAVGAAYAAQGLGYATVVTALPAFKARLGIDDTAVSMMLLGTVAAAAVGSVLADRIAVRWGSRQALAAGLAAQAAALIGAAFAGELLPFVLVFALYGVGLGAVDAASNMQGVLVQRDAGRPILGRLYAGYTAAAIVAAVGMSLLISAGEAATAIAAAASAALLIAAAAQLAIALLGLRWFDPDRAAHRPHDDAAARPKLPRAGIWALGALVFAAFAVDAAVSSWSTLYLSDGLAAAAELTPLGYAAYQVAVLLARLLADPAVRRFGRLPVAATALAAGVLGCALVAAVPTPIGAIAGFAIAGLTTGALVPVAFSAAGELLPERSDEVIARVNLFNYLGVVGGAVLIGLVGDGSSLGVAFLIPAAFLLLVLPALRRLRRAAG